MTTPTPHRPPSAVGRAVLALALLFLLAGITAFGGWVFLQRMEHLYRHTIYPHVYALGADLGGMRPDEAALALVEVADHVDTGLLVLTDGEDRWSYPWSVAGLQVDVNGTADAAFAVGRGGTWRDKANVWLNYHDVAPRFMFDISQARALLEELDAVASQPVIEPTIHLDQGEVVLTPGQAGRVLDIENTLAHLNEVGGSPYRLEIPLVFETLEPATLETAELTARAEALLARQVTVLAFDPLTEETLSWNLARDHIAGWLHLIRGEGGVPTVDVNQYDIRDTLIEMADALGDGRGFRYDEAAGQVFEAFDAEEPSVWLYLTHPERTYAVQAGDTLTSLSGKFGMPPGLVAEANRDIDIDKLSIDQIVRIPSQDVLMPHMPVQGKRIVVSLAEQRVRVYENGGLIYDWVISTGIKESPTHRGTFQVLAKHEEAYASQWELWMPYFIAVYPAGGGVENGFHELPILASGARLWAGNLGSPASFGCIILGIPAAQTLYDWAEVGVTVVIE